MSELVTLHDGLEEIGVYAFRQCQLLSQIVISKMLVRDLRSKATLLGINTQKRVTHHLVTRWEGKGKGMLQILWERGWIDESMVKEYKVHAEDDVGMIIPEYSLTLLMENCTDFKSEMSQLEIVCHSIGCKALITTKYHAEFAGEGIKYSWGLFKAMYRNYPLVSKKGKWNVDALVLICKGCPDKRSGAEILQNGKELYDHV